MHTYIDNFFNAQSCNHLTAFRINMLQPAAREDIISHPTRTRGIIVNYTLSNRKEATDQQALFSHGKPRPDANSVLGLPCKKQSFLSS